MKFWDTPKQKNLSSMKTFRLILVFKYVLYKIYKSMKIYSYFYYKKIPILFDN